MERPKSAKYNLERYKEAINRAAVQNYYQKQQQAPQAYNDHLIDDDDVDAEEAYMSRRHASKSAFVDGRPQSARHDLAKYRQDVLNERQCKLQQLQQQQQQQQVGQTPTEGGDLMLFDDDDQDLDRLESSVHIRDDDDFDDMESSTLSDDDDECEVIADDGLVQPKQQQVIERQQQQQQQKQQLTMLSQKSKVVLKNTNKPIKVFVKKNAASNTSKLLNKRKNTGATAATAANTPAVVAATTTATATATATTPGAMNVGQIIIDPSMPNKNQSLNHYTTFRPTAVTTNYQQQGSKPTSAQQNTTNNHHHHQQKYQKQPLPSKPQTSMSDYVTTASSTTTAASNRLVFMSSQPPKSASVNGSNQSIAVFNPRRSRATNHQSNNMIIMEAANTANTLNTTASPPSTSPTYSTATASSSSSINNTNNSTRVVTTNPSLIEPQLHLSSSAATQANDNDDEKLLVLDFTQLQANSNRIQTNYEPKQVQNQSNPQQQQLPNSLERTFKNATTSMSQQLTTVSGGAAESQSSSSSSRTTTVMSDYTQHQLPTASASQQTTNLNRLKSNTLPPIPSAATLEPWTSKRNLVAQNVLMKHRADLEQLAKTTPPTQPIQPPAKFFHTTADNR